MTGRNLPKLSLETYERQLDRIQSFHPRIDTKVSALFAIASGQIAVAALNLSANDLKLWWIAVPLAVFLLTIGWALLNLYRCAYPHLDGGNSSLVFFSEIAKLRESDYINKLGAISEADYKADVAGQIWRNSEIVSCKYRYLKNATIAAMLSLIPWVLLLGATSLSHGKLPVIGS
jgi:Family of unknown function (DUF5706)